MNNKGPVVFKSEDSLWQLLQQGVKTWDARRFDTSDERILRLSLGHWEKTPHQGRLAFYKYNEPFVGFVNKLTGQTLLFRYRGFTTPGWAPGWCFLQLGELVYAYDADGSEAPV